MAFEGGPLNVVGLTPVDYSQSLANITSSGAKQAFKGAGGDIAGSTGQYLISSGSKASVNVALGNTLGNQISGPGGASLNSGQNFLASTLTPFVSASVAQTLNRTLQSTLQSAGPFGNLLAPVASNLVSSFIPSLSGGGGGGGGSADYGGKAYTLRDITFSLRPANAGPQSSGLQGMSSLPQNSTSVPTTQYTGVPIKAPNYSANLAKASSMGGQMYQSNNIPLSFF